MHSQTVMDKQTWQLFKHTY